MKLDMAEKDEAGAPLSQATPKDTWDDESKETESEDLLDDGDIIDGRFIVVEKLQSGSFGQVFLALDSKNDDLEVALKVEKPRREGKRSYCDHEVKVMKRCQGRPRLPQMFGYSTTPICYIAMQLMSFTLTELRRSCPSKVVARFSLSTTIRVAIETSLAIRELHAVGVIHRDIKPSNFMIGGTASTKRIVYLLDFGLSRFFRNDDGEAIPPREKPGFVGSCRYASRTAHEGRELGRGDDLMSWLYMVVEVRTGRLPWKNVGDRRVVGTVKRITPLEDLCRSLPKEMLECGKQIQPLTYKDEPPYDKLQELLRTTAVANCVEESTPFDWEEGYRKVLEEDSGEQSAAEACDTDQPATGQ